MSLNVLIYRHYQPGSGNDLAVSGKESLLSILGSVFGIIGFFDLVYFRRIILRYLEEHNTRSR